MKAQIPSVRSGANSGSIAYPPSERGLDEEVISAKERGALRLRVAVRGAVQGVGYRPFVYRLATGMGLKGWVNNSPQGVFIEVEGEKGSLDEFLRRLSSDKPPRS